ncbi:3-keto-5-aminohexanoate cleavage protein [Haematospirillum jordaniae]|uniref:3-keto-5-aminohexanoate cleavage protein n=1 Tax=Haematospirillum jordaniae TaxID=1549855 RepID=A0A143DG05_9PROT|nr:3-keto-5-aminohexanoate cleavage protein [Haematospirillum jordaniae]AMW35576.1 3-keto-5-aminohexanoate cleavage protein [Haematospirillum jordaniae]NKD45504.1 3-keto-5-aminohexanoate cleavage protein [Haematospirillum jordaniae]NKD56889.1 3-keto-5-aminohexanoate cleavage protein [Haematospirillum jordaniae]NKD58955.1 3-keto-5-aminohexanoate cleavage protein [Haematospirillum jordaniae]NKD66814.1 3-keto-5-aminohexanoate cleavage protein [Haematospirillum jordaniae]
MSRPVVVCCAITGSRPRKADNPAVPVAPAEQVESAQDAFESGATLLHLHVRDDNENPSFDPDRFATVMEGVARYCPGMVVELSTGGVDGDPSQRLAMLPLRPEMVALAPGSFNMPGGVYLNPPDVVHELGQAVVRMGIKPTLELFDLSMLYATAALIGQGLLPERPHFHIVLGGQAALPARRQVLDFMVAEIRDLFPDASWMASGLGSHQDLVMDWALSLGGHIRTGLEDNIRLTRHALAESNGQLVRRAVARCMDYGCRPANVAETRRMLGLPEHS